MRSSLGRREGFVVGVSMSSTGVATVSLVDRVTGGSFSAGVSSPSGISPIVGDFWACTSENGVWCLDYCLVTRRTGAAPQTSFRQVMQRLIERGLVDPSFLDGEHPEAFHLAYIGEVRWFAFVPDPYFWLPCDGAAVSRLEYRELAGEIDSEGTSATFLTPVVPNAGAVQPYVCAR